MGKFKQMINELADNRYWMEEDDDYPVSDWKYEVRNDDTRLGYWEWVGAKRESDS